MVTTIIYTWIFNLFSPNLNTSFSLDWVLLVYILPDARLSRYSRNKYGLIKLDRVAILSYDYGIFLNMKTPCLSY